MAVESKLQSRIRIHLTKKGWLVVKQILTSKPGWPDLLAIKNKVIFLEIKSKGKKADPLQKYVHLQIRKHGGEVYTIDSWEKFIELNLD